MGIAAFAILTLSGAVAASQESPKTLADLPPQGSVKLSQLILETEGRAGFHAIKRINTHAANTKLYTI